MCYIIRLFFLEEWMNIRKLHSFTQCHCQPMQYNCNTFLCDDVWNNGYHFNLTAFLKKGQNIPQINMYSTRIDDGIMITTVPGHHTQCAFLKFYSHCRNNMIIILNRIYSSNKSQSKFVPILSKPKYRAVNSRHWEITDLQGLGKSNYVRKLT